MNSDGDGDEDRSDEEDEDEGGDEEEEKSSGEGESEESDSEEGDDKAADQVRKKIEDALKTSGMDVGKDHSEEDSDEELMDDEQMMALDHTLAEIFRTRANERKSKQGALTFFFPRRAFIGTGMLKCISRGRRSTRSNAFQEPSPRPRGYLCQTGDSESSQRSTRATLDRTRN